MDTSREEGKSQKNKARTTFPFLTCLAMVTNSSELNMTLTLSTKGFSCFQCFVMIFRVVFLVSKRGLLTVIL